MKNLFYVALLVLIPIVGFSQEQPKNRIAVGFQLNQFQQDFGLGVNIASPIIAKSIQIRARGNFMFLEPVENRETVWEAYNNVMLGVSSASWEITSNIALYGEGGVIMVLPSSSFSSSTTEFGGYGVFGFEFYFDPSFSYFVELGGVGLGAQADRVPLNPIYSNGFLTSVGFRIGF